ncbi:unnamed protein product, partial [Meganyctiphanes norvegica]
MASSVSGGKRSAADFSHYGGSVKRPAISNQMLACMNDPNLVVEADERVVIMKEKYPKALYHFLVTPREHIPSLKSLKREQSELLRYMEAYAHLLATKYPGIDFRYGYHAIPSMSQIHLHMISQEFDSPCLKTKRHWNSFNSRYFLDSKDVIRCLEERGMVVTMTPVAGEKLLDQPLKCNKCVYAPQNIPKLKQHLNKHSNN